MSNYGEPARARPIDHDPDTGDARLNQAANNQLNPDASDWGPAPKTLDTMGPGMKEQYGPVDSPWDKSTHDFEGLSSDWGSGYGRKT